MSVTAWFRSADAQDFQDFTIPTGASGPVGIAAGPDGNLWFTESVGKIGRITTSGDFAEFPIAAGNSTPLSIVAGPDGNLWFTESISNQVGRITTSGVITLFPVSSRGDSLQAITVGPDGALWFTNPGNLSIGRMTTSGTVSQFSLPSNLGTGSVGGIAAGSDGALWFTDTNGLIGRITTSGVFSSFPTPGNNQVSIAPGPDGALWYTYLAEAKIGRITTSGRVTEFNISNVPNTDTGIAVGPNGAMWFTEGNGNVIGFLTTAGVLSEFTLPSCPTEPEYIAAGPDGAMWFTIFTGCNFGSIGRLAVPAGAGTPSLVAAVLPASRSAVVGNPVTAFATMINTGSAASGCAITPVTPVPASFLYQTTNPATNALTGNPNTPVAIAGGGSQSFVVAFTPSAPFVPTNVVLGFDCAGTPAAASVVGLNTLLLSGSSTPVPDIVALVATASDDGILHIPSGSNAFAVATVDVGAAGVITATVNTGSASLPLRLSLCETDPTSGACVTSPSSSVTTSIAANATPTFAIFGTASGAIPFDPAGSRIFVQFTDAGGIERGATSVAVETQ